MLARNWKKILITITIILCLMNVIVKLNLAMPFIKQLSSVVTREVFTEDENNKSKTVELDSEGKYVEAK